MLARRIRWAALAIAAAALTGCATHVNGSPVPGEIDVRTLDVGNYATSPLEVRYHMYRSVDNTTVLAEMRLDGAVVTGPEIDPRLTYGLGYKAFSDPDDGTGVLHMPGATTALKDDGLMFGLSTSAAESNPDDPGSHLSDGAVAKVVVMQFPDEAAATKAAADLEAADFAIAAAANQAVVLPKYPTAHAHWRPGIATIGSYVAHGDYVINAVAGVKDVDLGQLTGLVQQIFDAQLPLLDALKPLDREAILRLKDDPDDMLRQTLNIDGMGIPDFESQFASSTRGFLHHVTDEKYWRNLLGANGVDSYSQSGFSSSGITMLFRARDAHAAAQLSAVALQPAFPGAAEAPPQVPEATCGEGKTVDDYSKKRYRCAVHYGRYVALVESDQLTDVHQRAAAQYALMANSTW
ncbi:hypothetical protein ACFXHA_06535 [Nocardia sp. NPDC059240]|uniref:DUF7373 family lipoprotein n=1 Tax=Nocardia sp. NPDC059240 TaxID=3346786 RepID=UPI0036BC2C77